MQPETDTQQPLLILIRGLPGSGKSYLANALHQALGNSVVALDPDTIDLTSDTYKAHATALAREGVDPKLFPYRFLRAQAYKGIETGKVIVWNQPFTNLEIFHKMLDGLKNYAAEHGAQLQILLVEVETDPGLAKQRVASRKAAGGHGPSDNTFERFSKDYASFADQGYQAVTVYGNHDANESVATVLSAIKEFRRG